MNKASPTKFDKLKLRWKKEREGRHTRAVRLRKHLLERGTPVFKRYHVRKVVLFGSVQNGRCSADADIDILVSPLSNSNYWEFKHDLEAVLGTPVDLYTNLDEPVFVQKIQSRGEVIYEV